MSNPGVKDDSSFCMPVRQAISYSGFTGESIPEEYQDCGVSPMLLMGEPPWLPPGPDCSFAGIRDSAITRYKEKKKRRKYVHLFAVHLFFLEGIACFTCNSNKY
jgi:hypothetical protein